MGTKLLLLLLLPLHLLPSSSLAQSAAVKSAYWFPEGGLPASSIDSTLFTHLFCAFAALDTSTYTLSVPPSFSSFTSTVRSNNPSVVTLLSIGGGSAGREPFSAMASSASSRRSFISSSISLARSNGFSGLDLDWEGDGWTPADMSNLASLLSEWRSAIRSEAARTGRTALLLTAALAVGSTKDGAKYPVDAIRSNLDWVNVMAYDFYAPQRTRVTAAHAALYDPAGGPSGSAGVADWIGAGLPANKIVLGLPYYGYAWALANPNNHGLGAEANGPASGPGIDSDGSITYSSVRDFIQTNNAAQVYNATVVVNYCYAGSTWIGYDDVAAISAKVNYAKGNGLRGYFAWAVFHPRFGLAVKISASLPPLDLTEGNIKQVLADARSEFPQIFDASVGMTGEVDLAELDGPFVKISLKGRFWHERSTVLARISNYLKIRIPEILEVDIEDEKQLDDSPASF